MNQQSMMLVRAIRGPVILITLGTLFAFDKFTDFRFGETWPVLLIVIGLLSLAGGGRSRRTDNMPPPPSSSGPDR